MEQPTFAALEYQGEKLRTRREVFLGGSPSHRSQIRCSTSMISADVGLSPRAPPPVSGSIIRHWPWADPRGSAQRGTRRYCGTKPKLRWDVHFGTLKASEKVRWTRKTGQLVKWESCS